MPRALVLAALAVSVAVSACSYESDSQTTGGGAHDAMDRMIEQRRANISALLGILKEGPSKRGNTVVAQAIRTLGELRAAGAATELVRHLSFEPDPQPLKGSKKALRDTKEYWPAVGALVKIGLPAVEPLVELMATSDEEKNTTLAGTTTLLILGYDMRNSYLQAKIRETDDEQRRKRLESYIVSAPTQKK